MNRNQRDAVAADGVRGPIPNSYWVDRGRLLAGEYPGALDESRARGKISSLLDAGIRRFIDLTEEGELNPYAATLAEEAEKRNIDVEHFRFPITDGGIPNTGVMRRILDAIWEARERNVPVYVHCCGGRGRTGVVVGCHLAETSLIDDFRRAVKLAVNHSGDSDSTGSIVGNLLGAAVGVKGIPGGWLARLELDEEIKTIAIHLRGGYVDDEDWLRNYPVDVEKLEGFDEELQILSVYANRFAGNAYFYEKFTDNGEIDSQAGEIRSASSENSGGHPDET